MGIKLSKVSYTYYAIKKRNFDSVKYSIKDISFDIQSNDEFICVVGHTGSGKSTLIQHMNLLLKPSNGEMHIDGEQAKYDIISKNNKCKIGYIKIDNDKERIQKKIILKPLRKQIGLVFQFPEYQIFEETVLKDIMFGPLNFSFEKNKEKREADAEECARTIAKRMKIDKLLEESPFELSGGQMRKVAIAGILASNPDILVLDEPTVGLDPLAKRELLLFLKELNEVEHKSIVLITHDMDVVGEFAKRVIVMNKGEMKYDGDKDQLFRNEKCLFENNLNYPSIISLLKKLKEKLNYSNLNEYQYNIEDAYKEIEKAAGDQNE